MEHDPSIFRKLLKSRWLQAVLITLAFAALYPVIRALPGTECTFLHYDYVGETPEGSEFCSVDDSWFLDLNELEFPVEMMLNPESEIVKNQSAEFSIQFLRPDGTAIQERQLAVVHERKIHLLIIDQALEDYRHVHPLGKNDGFSDIFFFSIVPRKSGRYTVYADIVPKQSRSQVIGKTEFFVPGQIEKSLPLDETMEAWTDSLHFTLNSELRSLRVDDLNSLELQIASSIADHSPNLKKTMGAYAHLVAFDIRGRGFAHMHPVSEEIQQDGVFKLNFSFRTQYTGNYKVWAQVFEDEKDGQQKCFLEHRAG